MVKIESFFFVLFFFMVMWWWSEKLEEKVHGFVEEIGLRVQSTVSVQGHLFFPALTAELLDLLTNDFFAR